MTELVTRRRMIGAMGGGALASIAGLSGPGLGGAVGTAGAAASPVLPGLVPGGFMPAMGSTTQLAGVVAYMVAADYPAPSFVPFDAGGTPLGTLTFTLARSPGAVFTGSDIISWTPATGHPSVRELHASVPAGSNTMRSEVVAASSAGRISVAVEATLDDASREIQPVLRLHGGTYSTDDATQTLHGLPAELKLVAGRSEDARAQMRFLDSVEQAARSAGGAAVLSTPEHVMLSTLITDPLILAYASLNPATNVSVGGPWNVVGAMVCIAGKYAPLTPGALALWGLGCTMTIAAPALDQSSETGFTS